MGQRRDFKSQNVDLMQEIDQLSFDLEACKKFVQEKDNPLLVIIGPTASGKTMLSIKLAKILDGEIISTDSRQIYKEMDIATAVVEEKEMEEVPHHLIKFRKPDEPLSVAEYKDLANQKIEEIYKRGKLPILAGGTGLYISAIIEDYDIPKIPPNEALREMLEKEAEKYGNTYIHEKLKKLDPKAAKSIHPNNLRYLIRAIEINQEGKQQKIDKKAHSHKYDTYLILIKDDRKALYQRINERTEKMMADGLVEEVENLLEKGYDESLPSISSVGVKEIIPFIKGEITKEEAIEMHKQNTRRYAKRQMTWFRRYKDVHAITVDEIRAL